MPPRQEGEKWVATLPTPALDGRGPGWVAADTETSLIAAQDSPV